MMVSREARVLFVHVQKTGGSTVDLLLKDKLPGVKSVRGLPGSRHAHLAEVLDVHPEYADFFIFGFVRNPWARLFSWHSMIMRRQKSAERGKNDAVVKKMQRNELWIHVSREYPDFESFILRGLSEVEELRTPQLRYLRAPQRSADFIGRTESFDADLRVVLDRLEIDPPEEFDRRNANRKPKDFHDHYTDAMRDRVAEVFAEDIAEFGYEF